MTRRAHTKNGTFLSALSKKGQMEAVGLVIIVILITLGILFMAIFAFKEEPDKKIFTRKGLAYSTTSAIMKTTVNDPSCVEEQTSPLHLGKDILEDCAANFEYSTLQDCQFGCKYTCDDKHSCLYFHDTVERLLNVTLGQWNKKYELRVELLQGGRSEELVRIDSDRGNCAFGDRDSSGLFPLQLTGIGLVKSELYLCD